ncbi:MAG: FAD-dependent oxidoreductase [Actinomycetota bacterium]
MTSTDARPGPTKTLPEQAQVVIIGGGIVGASIAYHLALRGWTDVVLLEKNTLTSGTTWHAAGLVGQLRATHNMTRLAAYGAELYEELERDHGFPTGFERRGSLAVAADHERMEELLRGADMASVFGVEVNPVTPADIAAAWPLCNVDDLVGGVHVPRDGQTSPVDTTMALAAAAKAMGVRVIEGVEVTEILTDAASDTAVGVATTSGHITCEKVVTAAGMWSRHIAATAGVSVPLHGCEHFYLVTEGIDDLGPLPTLRDPGSNTYIKAETGRLLVGFFEPVAKPIDVPDLPPGSFLQLDDDWEHLAPVFEQAMHRMPILGEIGIRLFFNGPESFTPDDAYLLGETPELRNHFVAAGFNSIGIQSAGGAGRVLADWIIDDHPPMDLADVDIRRFHPFQGNRRYVRDRSVETLGLLYEMHWPFRQKDTARGARRSPLHERLVAAGACMGETAGWERPNWYAPTPDEAHYVYTYGRQNWFEHSAAEHRACRDDAALFDLTSFAKFSVEGPDACAVLNRVSCADVDVEPGRTVYTQWLNDRGGIEADLTVSRLAEHRYMVVTSVGAQSRDVHWLRRNVGPDDRCVVTDITSGLTTIALMGPRSRDVLTQVTDAALDNDSFPFATLQDIAVGYAPVTAVRLTYVGELGWELYVPTEFTAHVYDELMAAGADNGLRLAGYHALNSLRIEKGYRHWGHDITDEDTPLQAGLSFTCAWDKPGGFTGREALLRQKEAGVDRRLVQFVLDDPEPLLLHDEPIVSGGEIVGHLTSGAYGHTLGASVGMGYVRCEPGTKPSELLAADYEIQVVGRRYRARAATRALHDPDGKAIRG